MRRRSLLLGLAATAGLVACGDDEPAGTTPEPSPSASAVPILGSTAASSLPPQSVTPVTPAPGVAPAGAFAVGRRDFTFSRGTDRPLPTRVWYPAEGTPTGTPADDAAPAAGSYPLIMFSHGLTSTPEDFAAMLSRWAQAGFVVAGPTFPRTSYGAEAFDPEDIVNQPADVEHVLDAILALSGDPLRAVVDPDRPAAAGHSGGGITTVGLFSKHRDARLKAGMVIAGTDFQGTPFTGPPAPMLFVHGTADETVTWQAGHTVCQAVPWSRAMLTIDGGGHVIESSSFEPITQTSTEFWRWALYGDAAARTRIPAAAAVNGVATLDDQL